MSHLDCSRARWDPTETELHGEPALSGAPRAEVHPQAATQDLEPQHVACAVAPKQRGRSKDILLQAMVTTLMSGCIVVRAAESTAEHAGLRPGADVRQLRSLHPLMQAGLGGDARDHHRNKYEKASETEGYTKGT